MSSNELFAKNRVRGSTKVEYRMFGGEKTCNIGCPVLDQQTGMKKMDPGNEHKFGSLNFACYKEKKQ